MYVMGAFVNVGLYMIAEMFHVFCEYYLLF